MVTLPGRRDGPNARALVAFVLDTRPWRFQEPKHTTFREVDRGGTQAYRAVQDTVLLRLTRRIEKIGKPVALDPREAFFTRSVEWCRLTSRTVVWSIGSLYYRTLGLSDTRAIGHGYVSTEINWITGFLGTAQSMYLNIPPPPH